MRLLTHLFVFLFFFRGLSGSGSFFLSTLFFLSRLVFRVDRILLRFGFRVDRILLRFGFRVDRVLLRFGLRVDRVLLRFGRFFLCPLFCRGGLFLRALLFFGCAFLRARLQRLFAEHYCGHDAVMKQFGLGEDSRAVTVCEGDTQSFGKHEFAFVGAPMVHWPEAMVSFDTSNGVLFSADAFGTFGALGGRLFADEMDFARTELDDARRYYCNIVGKYGAQTQALLKKAAGLDIKMIAPLHGPVWRKDIPYFIDKYQKWSTYTPEDEGAVMVVYGSMSASIGTSAAVGKATISTRHSFTRTSIGRK